MHSDRRRFMAVITSGAASAAWIGCSRSASSAAPRASGKAGEPDDDEVTPAEDLMREHGVLRRVMYLYDDAADRLASAREVPLDALARCAAIVRRVIEDYHEKLEEEFLFPRFERAGKLADLTAVLRRQHQAGRALTEQITRGAHAKLADADRGQLAAALRTFNHMYRPHAAREDTVLFPALRGLVGERAYGELGEQFEDREKQVLGDHGFERAGRRGCRPRAGVRARRSRPPDARGVSSWDSVASAGGPARSEPAPVRSSVRVSPGIALVRPKAGPTATPPLTESVVYLV